jgi:tetratricopeptide (TPR) repeat protein
MIKTSCVVVLLFVWLIPGRAQDPYNEAILALGKRDTAAARTAFAQAIREGRRIGESSYFLAAIACAQGDTVEASRHLATALERNAKDINTLKLAGDMLVARGRYGEAIPFYRRAAKIAPSYHELGIALGKALLDADSLDAALVQLMATRIQVPKNPEIPEYMGDAYARLGVDVMALSNYAEAARLAPGRVRASMKRARLLLEARNYTEAVKVLQSIHTRDSSFAPAYLEEATVFFRAKMYSRVLQPLRAYRRLQPGTMAADSMYLRALMEVKDFSNASRIAAAILHRDSSSVENWQMLAACRVNLKDYAGARLAYEGLQRHGAMTATDQTGLGRVFLQMNEEDQALMAFERAVRLDSSACEPYYDLGVLYMKKRAYAEAASMFERRLLCDSMSVGSMLNAGACYLAIAAGSADRRQENLDRAGTQLRNARERAPANLTVRFRLAQYYVTVDSLAAAKSEYDAVLGLAAAEPRKYRREEGEAHAQIAMYYASTGNPGEAIASFRKAQAAGRENSPMQMNWGLSILQALPPGIPEEDARVVAADAVAHFRKAVQLDPQSAAAHFWLGEGLIRLRVPGDNQSVHSYTEEACKEFKRTLAIDPGHEGAKKEIRLRGCK